MEKVTHASTNQKIVGVTILISDKLDLRRGITLWIKKDIT